jgi:hypothetical protein
MSSRRPPGRSPRLAVLALASLAAAAIPACGGARSSAPGSVAHAPEPDAAPAKAAPDADVPESEPGLETYPTLSEAARAVLARSRSAEVIGFGEIHQSRADVKVMSSLRRFTAYVLPQLRDLGVSDLVIETWAPAGQCGAQEREVADDVAETTERPASTENEVISMIRTARAYDLRVHILAMGCEDYEGLFVEGEVDYDRLLRVLTRLLREKVDWVRAAQVKAGIVPPRPIAVYGGSLHNELYPVEETAGYSYAPALSQALGGRYVEIDLLVPEFIEGDRLLGREAWYPAFLRNRSPDRALVFERGPSSYVIIGEQGRR